MPNHLADQNSSYLLQHAENPVDWYPWGPEALEKARREDKPIFLSIGYAACHWCHVMAHESFEDPDTAAMMNEHFVNIKVDREERPDLDSIYMNAVVSITGQGGWPMSVFLTPQGQPFFGGTYFPPTRRYNMPSFREVLESVARLWREDRQGLIQSVSEITTHLQQIQGTGSNTDTLNRQIPEQAAMRLAQNYDWKYGGWGRAPKFPQPMAIEFLLRRAARGDQLAKDVATHALDAMSLGGMYDVIGGGFARYSTDDLWLVPHFEKMLYDNAQLARVYLHAYRITGNPRYRQVCEDTLDFIKREMMPQGSPGLLKGAGMYSSLDADSGGEEGKYYLWTASEISSVLSKAQSTDHETLPKEKHIDWADFFLAAFGVTEQGNFEGKNVLQRALGDDTLAERYPISEDQVSDLLRQLQHILNDARSQRDRPNTDDKVLTAWNALAIEAFAEAARYLKRSDYLAVAQMAGSFLLRELHPGNRLLRSWRSGSTQHNAYLEDYAALILGLLALYQSDPTPLWFSAALDLTNEMVEHFRDPAGGFFDTRDDHDPLLIRPKDMQDNATPSGNALAALALLEMGHYTGRGEWRDMAEQAFSLVQEGVIRYPSAFSKWLCAFDLAFESVKEVAILLPTISQTPDPLIEVLWNSFRPDYLAAISSYPPDPASPALLMDRPLLEGKSTAYVCQNFICQAPTNDPDILQALLRNSS
jgi:uncharacterized protein YyaL (SSP411 family)